MFGSMVPRFQMLIVCAFARPGERANDQQKEGKVPLRRTLREAARTPWQL